MSSVSIQDSHGELKRRLATIIGTDPARYADDTGCERHKRLTAAEVRALSERLGLGLSGQRKQQIKEAVMFRLGRDHRTGVRMWDASDLVAVIKALEVASDE